MQLKDQNNLRLMHTNDSLRPIIVSDTLLWRSDVTTNAQFKALRVADLGVAFSVIPHGQL